jgi:hypothetical protein
MPNQLQLQQYTPEQSQESINEIRRLVTEAELPAELLVEIGQWAQQVIQDRQKFPEFQSWLKSKGLPDSEIPDDADYQELAAMAAMGQAVQDMMPEQAPAQATGPVAPVSPEQMAGMAQQGRNGDTQLAHINAEEAAVLKQMGGTGTINPATGLPEYGFFSDLWKGIKKVAKAVAPYALPIIALTMPALIPAIGTSLGASAALAPVVGASIIAGGATALSGGDLKAVLSSAALTGLGSYLTPIVGKYAGGVLGVDSPTLQAALGSGIFSGSVVAARGGTVAQILTAAATGGAASYLGQVATNAINSAKITNTRITQGTFDDAVFIAADAKGLADAGLGKNQITEILQASGVGGSVASVAAAQAVGGATADSIAVSLSNTYGNNPSLYANRADGAQNSIIGGGNVKALESVQRAEDALFVAQDAQNLKAAGLNQTQIEQNLRAAGVSQRVASMAAGEAMRGATLDASAQSIVYAHGNSPTSMFGEPTTITTTSGDRLTARELGSDPSEVTTRAQANQQTYDTALKNATPDYSTGSTAGDIDFAIADAKQLYAQGLRGTQLADVLKASGMSAQQANYLGSNAGLSENTLRYDLKNSIGGYGKIPVYQAAPPPPPVVETPTTPVAPPTPPVSDPATNTTTQTFDDGSVLVTDTTTGQVVSATDTAGQVVVAPPTTTTPAQPTAPATPAQPTPTQPGATEAQVRADNLVRMNPNYTPEQVRDFLVRVYNFDPEVALTAARTSLGVSTAPVAPPTTAPTAPPTTTQVFDDGSQLITNTQTGQVISTTPSPVVTAPAGTTVTLQSRSWNPVSSGSAGTELGSIVELSNGQQAWVSEDGTLAYARQGTGWNRTPTTLNQLISAAGPAPTPTPTPAPTPTPTPEPDLVSTNVQVFDDGSVLVTGADGQVIGYVDTNGYSPTGLEATQYDDGSVLVTNQTGDPLGGVDNAGNTFNINNQGQAVYQGTQTPIAPPATTPTTPTTPVDEGYGEGFPENVDIAGSTPPPMPPPLEEPPTDDYSDFLDNLPPLAEPEAPVEPEIPYIPPYIPPEPTPPSKPPQGTYVPAAPDPRYLGRLPLPGLNPGYMEQGVEPMYQTTSPVQGQYYWGNQRGFANLQDLQDNYNRINNVPEQPWGAQRGWWEQPRVNPATYNYDMSFQPAVPQGQLPGYYGTPNVDYSRIAQNYVPVAPQLTPISEYKLARGQYYDASGNPVAG